MAAKTDNSNDGAKATVVTSKGVTSTEYVVEHAPDLPQTGVDVHRDEPVIQRVLIDVRNAEAKANADRVK